MGKAIVECNTDCTACGPKTWVFSIDQGKVTANQFRSDILMAVVRQLNEVTIPSHMNHTWSIKSLDVTGADL